MHLRPAVYAAQYASMWDFPGVFHLIGDCGAIYQRDSKPFEYELNTAGTALERNFVVQIVAAAHAATAACGHRGLLVVGRR